MNNENETTITDMDGDKLLVTWDIVTGDGAAVILEPLRCHSAVLDIVGVAKLKESLDNAETAYYKRSSEKLTGIDGCSCEPSASDRLFYKPRTIVLPNGEVRHFAPPNPPFEPCPAADDRVYGCIIVKATHPKRPSDPSPQNPADDHE